MEKQPLLNTYVNNLTMNETIEEICRLVEERQKSYVVPINVDVVIKVERDRYLKDIVDQASLTLVDGKPLVWIAKWHKKPVREKVSGSDLVPKLCKVAAQRGYSIFILGGADGVAAKAKEKLEEENSGIKIAGTYSPPFGFDKDKEELERINRIISSAHPDLLVVCLGCPKQEKWVYENYRDYDCAVSICAGATVDFLAGTVKRAPEWMRGHGLEWAYRLLQEPKRLCKRYLIDDMTILGLVWKYRKC